MADQKHDESFKVIDRRLFTEEGELRKEVLEQERREEEATSAKQKRAASPGSAGAAAPPSGSSAARPDTPPEAPSAASPAPSRGFQMLVDFLARNAALLLGGYADPRSGEAILDLDGAREVIDMLDALREKTRGNLAPDDDHLLVEVIGSLKLTFMELSKAAAQAMQEKAKSRT